MNEIKIHKQIHIQTRPFSEDDAHLYGSPEGKRDYHILATSGIDAFRHHKPFTRKSPTDIAIEREVFHNAFVRDIEAVGEQHHRAKAGLHMGEVAADGVAEVVPIDALAASKPESIQGFSFPEDTVQEIA